MDVNKIIYFLDCYLLMLDEGEEFKQIVQDYVCNEAQEWISETEEQIRNVLKEPKDRDKKVKQVLLQCVAYTRSEKETIAMLENSLKQMGEGKAYERDEESD